MLASEVARADVGLGDRLERVRIGLVEARELRAVEVEDADDAICVDDRNDDLAPRRRIAGDVAGELVDVGNDDRAAIARRGPAHARADADGHASRLAVEGSRPELAA